MTWSEKAEVTLYYTLGLIFIMLKLTDLIDWSWWWVTLPFWGPPAFNISIYVIRFVIKRIT